MNERRRSSESRLRSESARFNSANPGAFGSMTVSKSNRLLKFKHPDQAAFANGTPEKAPTKYVSSTGKPNKLK